MALTPSFAALIEDLLSPLGRVSVRRMFSGGGVYCEGVMFGLAKDDLLYLKADEQTKSAFEAEGCVRFQSMGKSLPYWQIPERLYDDTDEMIDWAKTALEVALRANRERKPRSTKTKPRAKATRSKT